MNQISRVGNVSSQEVFRRAEATARNLWLCKPKEPPFGREKSSEGLLYCQPQAGADLPSQEKPSGLSFSLYRFLLSCRSFLNEPRKEHALCPWAHSILLSRQNCLSHSLG